MSIDPTRSAAPALKVASAPKAAATPAEPATRLTDLTFELFDQMESRQETGWYTDSDGERHYGSHEVSAPPDGKLIRSEVPVRAFDRLDTNKSSALERAEVLAALNALAPEKRDALLEKFETEKRGAVSTVKGMFGGLIGGMLGLMGGALCFAFGAPLVAIGLGAVAVGAFVWGGVSWRRNVKAGERLKGLLDEALG